MVFYFFHGDIYFENCWVKMSCHYLFKGKEKLNSCLADLSLYNNRTGVKIRSFIAIQQVQPHVSQTCKSYCRLDVLSFARNCEGV